MFRIDKRDRDNKGDRNLGLEREREGGMKNANE